MITVCLSHHTKAERVKHKGRNESEYHIDADSAQGIWKYSMSAYSGRETYLWARDKLDVRN